MAVLPDKYLQLFDGAEAAPQTPIFMAGVVCHQRAYRLCWQINQVLGIELGRAEDLYYKHPKNGDTYIQCYEHTDAEYNLTYRLVANKTTGAMLATEHKNTDFFLLLKGEVEETEWNRLIVSMKNATFAAAIYPIEITSLKNREILYF